MGFSFRLLARHQSGKFHNFFRANKGSRSETLGVLDEAHSNIWALICNHVMVTASITLGLNQFFSKCKLQIRSHVLVAMKLGRGSCEVMRTVNIAASAKSPETGNSGQCARLKRRHSATRLVKHPGSYRTPILLFKLDIEHDVAMPNMNPWTTSHTSNLDLQRCASCPGGESRRVRSPSRSHQLLDGQIHYAEDCGNMQKLSENSERESLPLTFVAWPCRFLAQYGVWDVGNMPATRPLAFAPRSQRFVVPIQPCLELLITPSLQPCCTRGACARAWRAPML